MKHFARMLCCFSGPKESPPPQKPGDKLVSLPEPVQAVHKVEIEQIDNEIQLSESFSAPNECQDILISLEEQISVRRTSDAPPAPSLSPQDSDVALQRVTHEASSIRQHHSAKGTSSNQLLESSATEFWDKMCKTTSENMMCEALLLGLSRVRMLGAGGFGCVFQARWRHVEVAVKILTSNGTDHIDEMTKIEAQICEGLRHPNVIQTFQTRRAVVSQAWLDEITEKEGPHGMEDDAMRSLHTTMNFDAEMIDPRVLQCFESNDGFGAPDVADPSEPKYLSARDILSKAKVSAGNTVTVIIMELANVGTLDEAIKVRMFDLQDSNQRKTRQIFRAILRTMRDVAQGLSALHDMEIIHCDLKPSNVLLKGNRGDWRGFMAAVCDFGLSKIVHLNVEPEQKPFGTLIYMAPERFRRNMCKKSDIYSWGIILYQVVTSTEPYKDIPSGVIVSGVTAGKLRPKWPKGHLPELQQLYEKCVLQDPDARPSAGELVQALIEIENKLRLSMAANKLAIQTAPKPAPLPRMQAIAAALAAGSNSSAGSAGSFPGSPSAHGGNNGAPPHPAEVVAALEKQISAAPTAMRKPSASGMKPSYNGNNPTKFRTPSDMGTTPQSPRVPH
ncbi:hypothetical protein CEUSTIGMA_g11296.t1 [Chlamydomonas eustigma]|uniref:Protein kinase domain-containing protein n=1 Tax=Chlamydomonas eustigma TaxID=1157962 RepID=A0A250XL91_9CHLO|nr:hypothetical protein CEUSTIGMA_g11296.t1 [Chlamydomonas eustigma]|eukprot:GAX83871.1 hypothetical protein CEUSTIGMA_g11296.t1 [Chlamydomonas eustigma]